MWDVIERLQPPGLHKKNRGAIYRLIARVTKRMADDGQRALDAFFPLLTDAKTVAAHGKALNIPWFPFDTDDAYQVRVASAAFYLERQGMRGFVTEFLEQLVPGRYKLLEYPKIGFRVGYSPLGSSPIGGGHRLFVKVRDLSTQESDWILSFLDASLDPDVEIRVVPWVHNPVSPASIDLVRRLGGSGWIAQQLEDICPVKVELLPDDGLRIGHARLGYARLIPHVQPLVLVGVESPERIQAVQARLGEVLDDSIERRCS